LHAPIYPPRPHVLALSPASDLHSGQCQSLLPFASEILACVVAGSSSSYPNGSQCRLGARRRCAGPAQLGAHAHEEFLPDERL
jgi:hypothetical protein